MQYGTAGDGTRQVAAPGLTASCPCCGSPLLAKCGEVRVWHWAHERGGECDPWSEPVGPWHLAWQLAVPADRREVVMLPHRADVVTASGGVVELQHSPIPVGDVAARERFYGERMVWVFDVSTAWRSGRLRLRRAGRRDACGGRFRWAYAPAWLRYCQRAVLLDGGPWILRVTDRQAGRHGPATGEGRFLTRESVKAWMRAGSAWRGDPATVIDVPRRLVRDGGNPFRRRPWYAGL